MFHDIQETQSLLLEVFRNHLTKFNWKSVDDIEQITQAIRWVSVHSGYFTVNGNLTVTCCYII